MSDSDEQRRGPEAAAMDVAEFLARARAMEVEAEERYLELADQMEVHNNPEVAALFRELAEIEGRHARHFEDRCSQRGMAGTPPWKVRWSGSEGPETAPLDEVHYMMTPYHALRLALAVEQQAQRFFTDIAQHAEDPVIREMAAEFAEEEAEHVRLVEQWLSEYPEPEPGWDEDPDPPAQPF